MNERSEMDDPANLESLERESLPSADARQEEIEASRPVDDESRPSPREIEDARKLLLLAARLRSMKGRTPEHMDEAERLEAEANQVFGRLETRDETYMGEKPDSSKATGQKDDGPEYNRYPNEIELKRE